ncbi:MAG: glycosyltransferase family 2 protein, partial [Candidatus Levybacteria bacterium]|nr:glycosyltransferase family 2 protein [Candidatus Levybacteria bacterium]
TTLKANELFKEEKKVKFITIILYPKAKFLLNFFIRRGFLDGIEGFIFAIFMSFHSFLVRAKLWMLWQKNF